jgi:hypothetical protein
VDNNKRHAHREIETEIHRYEEIKMERHTDREIETERHEYEEIKIDIQTVR